MKRMPLVLKQYIESTMKERKKFILYLKVMLPFACFSPLVLVTILIVLGVISESRDVLIAIIPAMTPIPVGIVGIFKVISGKLFEDTHMTKFLEIYLKNEK